METTTLAPVSVRIQEIIARSPGIHFRELGRAAGLTSTGQLRHHIDRLARRGAVSEVCDGRYRRYFPAHHQVDLQPHLARLARPLPRRIVRLLLSGPMSRSELRRHLGCADSTLGYHLQRMLRQGDLETRRDRRACAYALVDPARVRSVLLAQELAGTGDGLVHPVQAPAPAAPSALGSPLATPSAPSLLRAASPAGPVGSSPTPAPAMAAAAGAAPAPPASFQRLSAPPARPPLLPVTRAAERLASTAPWAAPSLPAPTPTVPASPPPAPLAPAAAPVTPAAPLPTAAPVPAAPATPAPAPVDLLAAPPAPVDLLAAPPATPPVGPATPPVESTMPPASPLSPRESVAPVAPAGEAEWKPFGSLPPVPTPAEAPGPAAATPGPGQAGSGAESASGIGLAGLGVAGARLPATTGPDGATAEA